MATPKPRWRALEHVGRALGERDGTKPDDDLLVRSLRRQAQADAKAGSWNAAPRSCVASLYPAA